MNTPPESRSPSRADLRFLLPIVLIGAALRFGALGHGLPFSPGVDEPEVQLRALGMMRNGTLNPSPFFDYPTFYLYVQFVVAIVRFIVGAMAGMWSSIEQATTPALVGEFYIWGRAVTAAIGTATILITYHMARRLGRVAGLVAAALLAIQPLHVRESHYVLTDVPMTFLVALTMLLSVRAVERGTVRAFMAAGITAGLAAATKYNGGVVLFIPLMTLLFAPRGVRSITTCLSIVGCAAGAFLLAAPYTLLDLPAFLNGFGHLANAYASQPRLAEAASTTYLKHLRINLGDPGIIVGFVSLVIGLGRFLLAPRDQRVVWASALVFVPLWFMLITDQGGIRYGRYLLPLLPALLILVGGTMQWLVDRLARFAWRPPVRNAIVAGVIAVVAFTPAWKSVKFVMDNSKIWTTTLAYRWIVDNVPTGTRVVVESRAILLPPDRYPSSNESRLIEHTFEDYVQQGAGYLAASSQSFGPFVDGDQRGSPEGQAYRDLFRRLQLVYQIVPSDNNPGAEWRIYRVIP